MAVTVAFQKREWSLETRVKIRNFRQSQLPNTHTHQLLYTQREGNTGKYINACGESSDPAERHLRYKRHLSMEFHTLLNVKTHCFGRGNNLGF